MCLIDDCGDDVPLVELLIQSEYLTGSESSQYFDCSVSPPVGRSSSKRNRQSLIANHESLILVLTTKPRIGVRHSPYIKARLGGINQ